MQKDFVSELEKVEDLPTLPEVVLRILREIEDPDVSVSHIAELIKDDPAITAKILKIANSPYYATVFSDRQITSVPFAIARMGFWEVRDIVLSLGMLNAFSRSPATIDYKEFWRHCLSAAFVAREVAKFLHRHGKLEVEHFVDFSEECFVAALLHDVGIMILDSYFHDDFVVLLDYARHVELALFAAEHQLWGVGHCEVGEYLLKRWNLPTHLQLAVRYHHPQDSIPKEIEGIVRIVHLADFLTGLDLSWLDVSRDWKYGEKLLEELGLDEQMLLEILEVSDQEIARSEVFLAVSD